MTVPFFFFHYVIAVAMLSFQIAKGLKLTFDTTFSPNTG